jgi:predicted negative regulator of RcsB-dependent stress response
MLISDVVHSEVSVSTHLSRKELKQDNVALKVEETRHFFVEHRDSIIKAGVALVIVVVIGFASWFFISSRRQARQQALASAIQLQNAPVGTAPPNGGPSFPSAEAKSTAVTKALNSVMAEGSDEGYAAEYYLAGLNAANGKTDEAVKQYDHVAANASDDYASLAKLAKAQLLFSVNKSPEAQAILRDLMAHPTAVVSKEQAAMTLAQGIASTQPEEARKLLLPIASAHSDISQVAVAAMSELPAGK